MCLVQIKQAQIKFPLSGFWTVQLPHFLAISAVGKVGGGVLVCVIGII